VPASIAYRGWKIESKPDHWGPDAFQQSLLRFQVVGLDHEPTLVAIELYLEFNVVPRVVRPAIVTTAMRAAMRP
jgi:hypothetical protein